MLPRNHPDRIRIVFDDHRLLPELVQHASTWAMRRAGRTQAIR